MLPAAKESPLPPIRRSLLALLTSPALLLAGCADFPALDAAISDRARAADYPVILPLDALLAQGDIAALPQGAASLPARADALRARARALAARPVIDAATRARLLAAVQRHLPG